jgi:predicted transport protein
MSRDMYNTPNKGYWLRKIENANKKEIVRVDEYTIEHLLPQNPDLNDDWKSALGADYADIQAQYLHTVGNLTLTAYNSQYSDKSFAIKRDMPEIGLRHSPLFLNQGLGEVEDWNEVEILERAKRLGKRALTVWKNISLPGDVLDKYRPGEADKATGYGLDDFEHLQKPDIRALFEEIKGEILRIDPVVHEVIRKLYVAFKAETNFVDIVPQAQSLRLSLNMSIEELLDPRGIARDVTEIGTWGNGGVSLQVHPDTDLKYVLYLIRQSFDKQMNTQEQGGLSDGGETESGFDGHLGGN